MDHFKHIYQHKADAYHRMIAVEDVDGNLLPALQSVTSFTDKRVLDIGSGTGRIPLLLTPLANAVVALDLSRAMLREQRLQMSANCSSNLLLQADMRFLPLRSRSFNVAIAGWAIGHLCAWSRDTWQQEMAAILEEMHRVCMNPGVLFILETLTTGSLQPAPPTPGLARYYSWLESDWGFERQTIQTDYQFQSLAEAVQNTQFFFGEELSEKIRRSNWVRLPEWTGVWSKKL